MTINAILQMPCHCVIAADTRDIDVEGKYHWLSESEQLRAERFRLDQDRHCYILAHALKRYCLSQFLAVDPQSLIFDEGEKGKPICQNADAPYFNISHSGTRVLLALSSLADVGVDVELGTRDISDGVARYALNERQISRLSASANTQQQFMVYWTQKEAISKAMGLGLSMDFKQIECSGEFDHEVVNTAPPMYLQSRPMTADYVASYASTEPKNFELYLLKAWDSETCSVESGWG